MFMSDIKTLRKYHALLRPFFAIFLISILFDIGMAGMGLINPLFTRILFDYAYPLRDLTLLNITVVSIIVTYFLYFFLSVASDYLQIYTNQEITANLTGKVYHAIQCLPMKFHQEKKSGDLLIRITDDVENTINMVISILPTIVIEGGRFIIILLIALSINSTLTLLALVSVPLYILETKFYSGKLAALEQESIDVESDIYSRAQERIGNIKTIKAFGQEKRETLSFGRLIKRRYRVAVKGRLLDVFQAFTNSITLQVWSVFLTWYLGYQVVMGRLTIGEIVAMMLYIDQLSDPIHAFIGLFTEWKISLVSMRRLDEVLDVPSEETLGENAERLNLHDGEIHAKHISFTYSPDEAEDVLHDVDVHFPPRSVTAIVGGSGSGKSTLVNLFLRFFDPTDGMVLVDGQNISEVRIHELRNKLGIVAQDAALFDGTVMYNILYGNEGKSRADAMQAAQMAGAHDFIEQLHGSYDAPVGTGGTLLSGGQRQRIAIARTLLRNPSIVILDEATSALDAESEFHIQEVISQLRLTKTVIVIAHRLSTIKSADNILVLEDGRFVEEGRFNELVELKGAFYQFYCRQFGGLAILRQQLSMELERTTRYGSKFCLAILKVRSYDEIESSDDSKTARKFMDGVDFQLKRLIRMGDNCAILSRETILIVLPELNTDQLKQFFQRMLKALPRPEDSALPYPIKAKDLLFLGTRLTKKTFETPEELLAALKTHADSTSQRHGQLVIDEDDLISKDKKS